MNKNEPVLGKPIEDDQHPLRDAVHIAIFEAVLDVKIRVGSPVKLTGKYLDSVPRIRSCEFDDPSCIGILDPFLPEHEYVERNRRCWVFVKPRTITGLAHFWSHPLLPDRAPLQVALEPKEWLRDLAEQMSEEDLPWTVAKLMDNADRFIKSKGSDNWWGHDHSREVFQENAAAFWPRWAALRERTVPEWINDGIYYSCSC